MEINSIDKNNVTLSLDFSVEQIQKAIEEVYKKKSILYIADKERSSSTVFKMDVYNGINPASISITLRSKDEKTTEMTIIAQNANGGHASDVMLTEVLKDYLKYLQKALNGGFRSSKGGCMGKAAMITVVVLVTAAVMFWVS